MSAVKTELSLKVYRVIIMIFSVDLVLYNLLAPIWMALRKKRINFLICFRKRRVPTKGVFQPWRKLCNLSDNKPGNNPDISNS